MPCLGQAEGKAAPGPRGWGELGLRGWAECAEDGQPALPPLGTFLSDLAGEA